MQNDLGYPFTYGDSLSSAEAQNNFYLTLDTSSKLIVSTVIIASFSLGSANAVEPGVQISKQSLALTVLVCC